MILPYAFGPGCRSIRQHLIIQVDNVRELVPTLPAVNNDTFMVTRYVDVDLESLVQAMLDVYYVGAYTHMHTC